MKLKYIIKYPLKIFIKILKYLLKEFYEYKNPFEKRYQTIIKTYKSCGFNEDRIFYIETLNKILNELGYSEYSELEGMYSEHLIIFTAISLQNKNIKNILEIGTYDAKTTTILSRLFPFSKVTTIDLKDDDPTFLNTYSRQHDYKYFINKRNNLISNFKNIQFIKINSLNLSLKNLDLPKQDLIWVDGAHGYPVVASDITNAIGLMHQKSILMCDDIWEKTKNRDSIYKSDAGYETLSSFAKADIIENYFFRKRIGKNFNGIYIYISLSKLIV